MYAYQADLLRLLDWQRHAGRRWTLKSPAHMWGIDALIDTFPDVAIVWSHRDPLACIASVCSMTHAMIQPQVDVDPRDLGPWALDFYAESLERGLAARAQRDPAHFVDVGHDEFVADPLRVAERVYAHFGLELGGEARAAFEAHVAAHPKGRHGQHEYELERFGLTASEVRARFADYIERFDLAAA